MSANRHRAAAGPSPRSAGQQGHPGTDRGL